MLPPDVMTLVPRHPRLDPNVVSIDDRRIIQIFPGPSGEKTTWDGVRVKLEEGFVRVSSKTPHVQWKCPCGMRRSRRSSGSTVSA
jgi:hypothetical protein